MQFHETRGKLCFYLAQVVTVYNVCSHGNKKYNIKIPLYIVYIYIIIKVIYVRGGSKVIRGYSNIIGHAFNNIYAKIKSTKLLTTVYNICTFTYAS